MHRLATGSRSSSRSEPGTFPWATFWTNLSGVFVLGAFLTIVLERFPPTRYVRPFFGIGFLGAYTTFSTLAVETARLMQDGEVALAVGYTVASITRRSRRRVPRDRAGPRPSGPDDDAVPTIDEELEG